MSRSTKTAVARRPAPEVHTLQELADQTGASAPYQLAQAYRTATVDAAVDSRAVTMVAPDNLDDRSREPVWFTARPDGVNSVRILLNDTAHRQIAERIKIPFDYYQRMRASQPDLLATNVNRWLQAEPDRHLFRMLTAVTADDAERLGAVEAQYLLRAVRSTKYRCIDNAALLDVALPVIAQHGARVTQFSLTEERFHIRFATEGLDIEEARQQLLAERSRLQAQGLEVHSLAAKAASRFKIGEAVGFGCSISNSEVGLGAYLVEPFANIISCLNGMIIAESRRGVHLGRDKGEDGYLSDETRRLDDAAVLLKVRDKVIEVFHPDTMLQVAAAIEQGTLDALNLPKQLPLIQFVGNVGARFDLTAEEVEVLQEETVTELSQKPHPASRFTISQGLTATAKRAESFERRVELERLGWQVLQTPLEQLLEAGKVGQAKRAAQAKAAKRN